MNRRCPSLNTRCFTVAVTSWGAATRATGAQLNSLRIEPIVAGVSRWQEWEVAGHIAPAARKQRGLKIALNGPSVI